MAPTKRKRKVKFPRPKDPQQRMLKGDDALLIQLLESEGFEVHNQGGNRINAYLKGTKEFVCGFTWYKGTSETPGRWTFDLTLGDAHSWQDLKLFIPELRRIHTQRMSIRDAWEEYLESKSEKRWSNYLSHLALMFITRAPVPKDPTNA